MLSRIMFFFLGIKMLFLNKSDLAKGYTVYSTLIVFFYFLKSRPFGFSELFVFLDFGFFTWRLAHKNIPGANQSRSSKDRYGDIFETGK
jgi:hypothetical protein